MEETKQETTSGELVISDHVDSNYSYSDYKHELNLRNRFDPIVDRLVFEKGRADVWDVTEEAIKYLYKYHGETMKILEAEVKADREAQNNKHGSGKSGLRLLGSMPDELEQLLQRVFIDWDFVKTRKYRREFFKRYPQFRVAEKI